ncbi:MAG: glycosyltransferase [Promethearchaeota archaeon]
MNKKSNNTGKMINLLYISFSFPPINAAASFRAMKLTNLLNGMDVHVTVLTKTIDREYHIHRSTEWQLLKNVNEKTKVLRAKFFSPTIFQFPLMILKIIKKLFKRGSGSPESKNPYVLFGTMPRDPLIPDHYIEWFPFAFFKVIKNIRSKDVDVIFATGPPFTVHLLGYLLKAKFKVPLILEYRDPWTDDPYQKKFPIKEKINSFMEKIFLERADVITCVSKPLKERIINRHGLSKIAKKFISIPSAFDPEDFDGVKVSNPDKKDFILVLTTTLYGGRKPGPLFESISRLKKKGVFNGINFQLNIYGYNDIAFFKPMLISLDIMDLIHFQGLVPHSKCLEIMKNSTMNLDVGEGEFNYPTLPFHFWEYLGTGKKILFFGNPDSYKAKYILNHDLGYILPYNDPDGIDANLTRIIEKFKSGTLETLIPPSLNEKETWVYRARKLARIIKALVKWP